ncbi:tRNA (guanine(6)-N(2))-methyltransferase THUMP3-like [Hetaerina americana]|uniref:tRNA (guanine(6)-N(2))-methyltransferase THUMP3-like n=1 Tax=Hetaerina americana TaxID=62018 RepID=UPI003A7F2696
MENEKLACLIEISRSSPQLITVEATVVSGLEKIAEGECYEIFGKTTLIISERGRVYFNILREHLPNVFLMRSIDNVYIIVYVKEINFGSDKKEDLSMLLNCYSEIEWRKPISVWKDVYQYSGTTYPTKEEYETSKRIYNTLNDSNPKKCKIAKEKNHIYNEISNWNEKNCKNLTNVERPDDEPQENIAKDNSNVGDAVSADAKITVPKFRVSAKRVGTHSFTSEDVARTYGALIQEDFLWIVDLTDFNMEIMTNVTDSDFIISISLTKSSLHRRNLTVFGLTSLRATICYSLIKMALPQVGDVVIDPLSGSGSIPIEGAAAFPKSYFVAGDFQDVPCGLTKKNLENYDISKTLPLDVMKWDSLKLPIRNSSVDVVVTDMPFGKRSGSKKSNKVLYPGVLRELGRVLRKGTGRAVLLTADRRSLEMAHNMTKKLWNLADRRHVNVGGLKAVVFLLRRTLFD